MFTNVTVCSPTLQFILHICTLCIRPYLLSPGFVRQIMPYLCDLCYSHNLVSWTVVCLNADKFKPHTFVHGFALS
jgi:hypothetical protein